MLVSIAGDSSTIQSPHTASSIIVPQHPRLPPPPFREAQDEALQSWGTQFQSAIVLTRCTPYLLGDMLTAK